MTSVYLPLILAGIVLLAIQAWTLVRILEDVRKPQYVFLPVDDDDEGGEDEEPTHPPAPLTPETLSDALDRLQPSSTHVRLADAPKSDFRSSAERMMDKSFGRPYADGALDRRWEHEIDGRHEQESEK